MLRNEKADARWLIISYLQVCLNFTYSGGYIESRISRFCIPMCVRKRERE